MKLLSLSAGSLFLLHLVNISVISQVSSQTLLYPNKLNNDGPDAGAFGVATDPSGQFLYVWAQSSRVLAECGGTENSLNEAETFAFLIKFNVSDWKISWCKQVIDYSMVYNTQKYGTTYFWNGNKGPIVHPESGDIFVYGTYGFHGFYNGEFLFRYQSDGTLLPPLLNHPNNNSVSALAMTLDSQMKQLYIASAYNDRQVTIRRFDITEAGNSVQVDLSTISTNFTTDMILTAMTCCHRNLLYFVGQDTRTGRGFLAGVSAIDLKALTPYQPIQLPAIGKYAVNIGLAVAVDPLNNAIYVSGGRNYQPSAVVWRYALDNLTLTWTYTPSAAVGSWILDLYSFIAIHPTTRNIYCGGSVGFNNGLVALFPNGSVVRQYSGSGVESFSAAFIGNNGTIIVAGSYPLALYRAVVLYGYLGDKIQITTVNKTATRSTTITTTITIYTSATTETTVISATTETTPTTGMTETISGTAESSYSQITSSKLTAETTFTTLREITVISDTTTETADIPDPTFIMTTTTVAFKGANPWNSVSPLESFEGVFASIAIIASLLSLAALAVIAVYSLTKNHSRQQQRDLRKNGKTDNIYGGPIYESPADIRIVETTVQPLNSTTVTFSESAIKYSAANTSLYNTSSLSNQNTTTSSLATWHHVGLKELALPGPYVIDDPRTAFEVLNILSQTALSTLKVAQPKSLDLVDRCKRRPLVVKTLRSINLAQLEAFFIEVSVMYMFSGNERFAEFVGFTTQPYHSLMSIFYPDGSLDRFLYAGNGVVQPCKRLILTFAKEISEAVQSMHDNGFAHCDLKPHNVFIDRAVVDFGYRGGSSARFKCRLGDFGLVQVLDERHNQVGAFDFRCQRGLTFNYASPEAIKFFRRRLIIQRRIDHFTGCDVYALALVLYELCVCRLAWK